MRQAHCGSALAEYALAGAFMLGAVAFILTQEDWGGKLAVLQQDMMNAGLTSGSRTLKVPPLGTIARTSHRYAMAKENICFTSGTCVNMPVITPGTTVADTTGAMGGELTKSFADVMLQLAKEIEAKGGDPILVQLITELANAGHDTANYVKMVEGLIAKYDCDVRACTSDFIGQSELWRISKGMNEAKRLYYETIMAGKYSLLEDYLAANPSVLSSFPEAKAIIDLEYKQIGLTLQGAVDYGCADPASSCVQTNTTVVRNVVSTSKTFADPDTGASVTLTTYTRQDSITPLYETVVLNGVTTTYKIGLGNVRTVYTGTIPSTITIATSVSYEADISHKTVANNAELIHQDSNVICGAGGNTSNCTVDPNLIGP